MGWILGNKLLEICITGMDQISDNLISKLRILNWVYDSGTDLASPKSLKIMMPNRFISRHIFMKASQIFVYINEIPCIITNAHP
jgi:hypothetical protein